MYRVFPPCDFGDPFVLAAAFFLTILVEHTPQETQNVTFKNRLHTRGKVHFSLSVRRVFPYVEIYSTFHLYLEGK